MKNVSSVIVASLRRHAFMSGTLLSLTVKRVPSCVSSRSNGLSVPEARMMQRGLNSCTRPKPMLGSKQKKLNALVSDMWIL